MQLLIYYELNMEYLTVEKIIEIIFIYRESRQNIDEAVNLYALRYLGRGYPLCRSFYCVIKQFS